MKRTLAVALGLIVGFGFSVSFGPQVFGALPNNLNDRFMAVFGDAGSGTTYLRVSAVTDAAGSLPNNLNDRWYNAFVDAGGGLTALQVVCTGCGGGTATSVTLANTAIAYGDASNVMTGDAANFFYTEVSERISVGGAAFGNQYRTTMEPSLIELFETDGFGPALVFNEAGGGTLSSPTVSVLGDIIGQITFKGTDATPAFLAAANLAATADATIATGVMPGRLSLSTAAATTGTMTERLRVNNQGSAIFNTIGAGTGTNSGLTAFQIANSPSQPAVFINDATSAQIIMEGSSSAGSILNAFQHRGTLASPTDSQTNDQLFSLFAVGRATDPVTAGSIRAIVEGTVSASVLPTRWGFRVGDENGDLPETVRMSSDLRVSAASSVQVGGIVALNVGKGQMGMTKLSGTNQSPGAGGAKISVECGTNAGTAKIVAYAGTSTTGVTVVDNIGTGVTGC